MFELHIVSVLCGDTRFGLFMVDVRNAYRVSFMRGYAIRACYGKCSNCISCRFYAGIRVFIKLLKMFELHIVSVLCRDTRPNEFIKNVRNAYRVGHMQGEALGDAWIFSEIVVLPARPST